MADSIHYKSLPEVLYCKTCNYYTCNKKKIDKHLLSSKHIKNISIFVEPLAPVLEPPTAIEDTFSSDVEILLVPPNTPTSLVCGCCNKTYKHKAGLLRHQRSKQEKGLDHVETKDSISSLSDQENDNQSLELISEDDDSSNMEFEYITIDPLVINDNVMYFMHAFVYSIDIIMCVSVFINKFFSFFSLKSRNNI